MIAVQDISGVPHTLALFADRADAEAWAAVRGPGLWLEEVDDPGVVATLSRQVEVLEDDLDERRELVADLEDKLGSAEYRKDRLAEERDEAWEERDRWQREAMKPCTACGCEPGVARAQ